MKRQYVLAVLSACMFSLAGCGSVVTLNSTEKETQAQETEMQEIEMQEIKMQKIAAPEENSALQDSLQNVAKKNESSVKLAKLVQIKTAKFDSHYWNYRLELRCQLILLLIQLDHLPMPREPI